MTPDDDIGGTVAISLANWRAFAKTSSQVQAGEYPLFTDAHLVGEERDRLGPYMLLNTVAGSGFIPGVPSAVLRMRVALQQVVPNMEKSNTILYHGGTLEDEVVALVALELGIRLKAGPMNRWFPVGLHEDPLGRPVAMDPLARGTPMLESRYFLRIPDLTKGERDLGTCTRLTRLRDVAGGASVHLVKAARLYQEAVWICDVDPALSWLFLVSAVETAANYWRAGDDPPLERLRASLPQVAQMLHEAGGDALEGKVAGEITPLMGATKKFIDFLLDFCPPPPQPRPPDSFAVDWSPASLKKAFGKIYGYRSKALHNGTPFPYPMCDVPRDWGGGALAEKDHPAAATWGLGVVWVSDDLPMLLNTFHYIARQALLKWWDQLAPS